jgi:biopolymer transport protein ExbD
MLLALMLLAQTDEPVRIDVARSGEACVTSIDGAPVGPKQLEQATREWARKGWPVHIAGPADTPYRCVGGTIFALQRAGYSGIANAGTSALGMTLAPAVRLSVPRGTCAYLVNDARVSYAELTGLAQEWHRYRAEIEFRPNPRAAYRCLDKAMAVLRRAYGAHVGFIGNEQYRADTP